MSTLKTYDDNEAFQYISDNLDMSETDNDGQILIYTNLFRWNDGTIRNQPDPSWED